MSRGGVVTSLDGVPAHDAGRHPVAFAGPEQCADALETIEFGQVVELVAALRRGPARRRAGARAGGPPTTSRWIASELARVGEVAGLFRRGDRLLAEADPRRHPRARPASDRGQRARRPASWPRLQRVLVAARQVHADLRRVAETAPLAAALASSAARQDARAAAGAVASIPTAACSTPRARASPRRGARCTRPGQRLLRRARDAAARARRRRRAGRRLA